MENKIENGIVPIYEENFKGEIERLVNGRELHKALEIKTAYKDWFPRMVEYGFIEEQDFCSILSESTGGRPEMNHAIKLDMAKEIAMIQRSEIGRNIRKYFIEVEKRFSIPKNYEEALEAHLAEVKKNRMLQEQNMQLLNTIDKQNAIIESQSEDIAYLRMIESSPSAITITQLAKDYGTSNQDFNNLLVAIGFQWKVNKQWVTKDIFTGHKLTVSNTFAYGQDGKKASGNNQCVGSSMTTLITQKGRYRIYRFLKHLGIIPECEMENGDISSYQTLDLLAKIGKKMLKEKMSYKKEIPEDILKKIKEATKHFIDDEKVKVNFCIDESGKTKEIMVDAEYDYEDDMKRMYEARPWMGKFKK